MVDKAPSRVPCATGSATAATPQRDPWQRCQQRVHMQQLARLAPGAVGHHQQPRSLIASISLQRLRALTREQQAGAIPRLRQPLLEILEHLAHPQLGIAQAKRRQPGGVQGMVHFAGMLQQQYKGAAVQAGINAQRQWVCGRRQRSQ